MDGTLKSAIGFERQGSFDQFPFLICALVKPHTDFREVRHTGSVLRHLRKRRKRHSAVFRLERPITVKLDAFALVKADRQACQILVAHICNQDIVIRLAAAQLHLALKAFCVIFACRLVLVLAADKERGALLLCLECDPVVGITRISVYNNKLYCVARRKANFLPGFRVTVLQMIYFFIIIQQLRLFTPGDILGIDFKDVSPVCRREYRTDFPVGYRTAVFVFVQEEQDLVLIFRRIAIKHRVVELVRIRFHAVGHKYAGKGQILPGSIVHILHAEIPYTAAPLGNDQERITEPPAIDINESEPDLLIVALNADWVSASRFCGIGEQGIDFTLTKLLPSCAILASVGFFIHARDIRSALVRPGVGVIGRAEQIK